MDARLAIEKIGELKHLPGALLPVLHALQSEFGYIDDEAVPLVARALNLSEAEVQGVVGFYHDFRRKPPGRHVMRVCRAEACQAMGCEKLIGDVEKGLGVALGETTPDGGFTLEAVYCLGNCALSPALTMDGELHGRVSPETASRLIAEARR
jgi:formate dehydrogenase subunit gamma